MIDDLFGAYRDTHYSIEPRGQPTINIRVDQPSLATDSLFAQRDPPSVSIITSHNPRSEILPDSENQRRNKLLRREEIGARRRSHPAKGQNPDGQWVEASWAIEDLPLEDLRRIAIFHGQNAVVRIEKSRPAELIPVFDNLPIFAGSADELIALMREHAISAPVPFDWRKLWELVITLDNGRLELPSLRPPPDYRAHSQAEQEDPENLRDLFHLHLKAIEGSALHWDLARAAITQAMRWRCPLATGRKTLFDLQKDSDLDMPLCSTKLELGIYGE